VECGRKFLYAMVFGEGGVQAGFFRLELIRDVEHAFIYGGKLYMGKNLANVSHTHIHTYRQTHTQISLKKENTAQPGKVTALHSARIRTWKKESVTEGPPIQKTLQPYRELRGLVFRIKALATMDA
jgi:hypothetical protein